MKTDLFQSCGHCSVFQICWHIECSSFTASSFRIWNSSTGILSPLLALFVVMLSKAHLTSHSRMSGSRWVITPLWLPGLWTSFFYRSSVYSCYLFLISSASARSIPFLSFIVPIFAWNIPLVSLIFLKRSLVFPILFFPLFICTDHWGSLSYLSLLFFGNLHSNGYIFTFLLCFGLSYYFFFSHIILSFVSIFSSSIYRFASFYTGSFLSLCPELLVCTICEFLSLASNVCIRNHFIFMFSAIL